MLGPDAAKAYSEVSRGQDLIPDVNERKESEDIQEKENKSTEKQPSDKKSSKNKAVEALTKFDTHFTVSFSLQSGVSLLINCAGSYQGIFRITGGASRLRRCLFEGRLDHQEHRWN